MSEKPFGIIYKATNLINGKCYIGQTIKDPVKYWIGHLKYAVKLENPKKIFYKAIRKYGPENFMFEVLEFCDSKEEMDEMEFHYIKQFKSHVKANGYNATFGGDGILGYSFNKESLIKLSIKSKRMWQNKSHKEYMRNIIKEKWKDEEYRKNIKEKSKITREKNPEKYSLIIKNTWKNKEIREKRIIGLSNAQKNLWKDEEYRKKQCKSISSANKEKWKDEEYRKKTIDAMTHPLWKELHKIKQLLKTMKQKEIAELFNCSKSLICRIVKEIKKLD